ncbi:MAG: hypothetical protein E2O39_14190 [Planctomycetota bacterium]|nr:MAG: hypothetical protein E2O39_14190 [Planctomycetota bacterium]
MGHRILSIVRAHLAGEWFGKGGVNLPIAPFFFHAFPALVLCGIARSELSLFGYAVFALSIPLALTTLPLLGELGPLLRADPAAEWIGAQPVRPFELRAARVFTLAILLGGLALGSLIPAAALAPASFDLTARVLLVLAGLAQTAFVAALLLWIQALLGGRAEAALVAVQTVLLCAVILGAVLGLQTLPRLAQLAGPSEALALYPPAWFATILLPAPIAVGGGAFWAAVGAIAVSALTFALAPFPPAPLASRARSPIAVLLYPFRRLATALWVRRDERASFDFVYDALPLERDFVIRTYPLIAVPLAFLLLGATAETARGEGLFAVLLFTPATYLPILIAHVPATATPEARWLIDTSPVSERAERGGALKAVAVRFLLPLYILLTLLTALLGGTALAMRLALPGAVAAFVVLRYTWGQCTDAPPLSRAPKELGTAWNERWTTMLFALAIVMTGLAIATWQLVESPAVGVGIAALVVGIEVAAARAARRAPGASSPGTAPGPPPAGS